VVVFYGSTQEQRLSLFFIIHLHRSSSLHSSSPSSIRNQDAISSPRKIGEPPPDRLKTSSRQCSLAPFRTCPRKSSACPLENLFFSFLRQRFSPERLQISFEGLLLSSFLACRPSFLNGRRLFFFSVGYQLLLLKRSHATGVPSRGAITAGLSSFFSLLCGDLKSQRPYHSRSVSPTNFPPRTKRVIGLFRGGIVFDWF